MTSRFNKSTILAALLVAGCETTSLERQNELLTEKHQEELINRSEVVAVVSSVDVAVDLEQKAAHWGYDLKRKEALQGLGLYILTFDCPPGIDPHVASAELERLQPLSTVEVNHKFKLQATNNISSLESDFTPIRYANSLVNWPEEGCESNLKIGIIDGAIDMSTFISEDTTKIQSREFIRDGHTAISAQQHATAIAEILVGERRLKNAEIFNAAVVSEDAKGVSYSGVEPMLKALNWMVQSDVKVVNISLAGPYNRTLDRGVQRAADKGLILVAAVGNSGSDSPPLYPAALKDVIAATAVDAKANIYTQAVQGQHVDVAAPGVEVFVGNPETGRYISGTSIATPFVVAKIASDTRFMGIKSPQETRRLLAIDTVDLGENGPDPVFGAGLIQKSHDCR